MVRLEKSRQRLGYDYYDYAAIAFTAVEQAYTVGTNANAALVGSWPSESGLPVEGQVTRLYATQDCLIRFVPRWIVMRQALAVGHPFLIPAGLPVQTPVPANTWIVFPDKWIYLYVVSVLNNGVLRLEVSG